MTRSETTKFLSRLLEKSRFSGPGKYWAREVSLDYGYAAGKSRRIDYMQFRRRISAPYLQLRKAYLLAMKSKVAGQIFIVEMD